MPETVARIPIRQLTAMITRTMFAISMEESRFTLNGALLLLGDKGPHYGRDRRTPAGLHAFECRRARERIGRWSRVKP